jgi:hypothetical protein
MQVIIMLIAFGAIGVILTDAIAVRDWREVISLGVSAIGGLLNFLVVIVNGGKMPVLPNLVHPDMQESIRKSWRHKFAGPNTRFVVLADRYKLGNSVMVYSIGDVCIVAGVLLHLFLP